MTPKAAAAADLIQLAEQVPAALLKIARAQEIRLERMDALHERLSVWMLEKKAEALGAAGFDANGFREEPSGQVAFNQTGFANIAKRMSTKQLLELLAKIKAAEKTAAAESIAPAQDTHQVTQAAKRDKTLQELMGTPDVQKWFQGSVRGLARRGNIPYALLSPDQEPQTNMDREQLKAILQKMLAAK